MSPYQERVLAHLVSLALVDKTYSWWAAKNFAQIDPHLLSEMPSLLTQEMRRRNEQVRQEGGR